MSFDSNILVADRSFSKIAVQPQTTQYLCLASEVALEVIIDKS